MNIIINMAVSCCFCCIISFSIRNGYLKRLLWAEIAVFALSAYGGIVLDVHEHIVWMLLLFHTYTDLMGRYVYSRITLIATLIELVIIVVSGQFMASSVIGLFISMGLIWSFGKTGAVASGDTDILAFLVIYGYGKGYEIVAYCAELIFLSCVFFIIYMCAVNLKKLLATHLWDPVLTGAFFPGIAAAFIVMAVV